MSFVIPTQEFSYLINQVQNVIPPKATVPFLSNFLLEVSEGLLKLTATDLMVSICCETDVKMLREGALALPAKRLSQLVRELTAPTLQVNLLDNYMTEIQAGTSKFKIYGMAGNEFPKLPDISEATSFTISQAALKSLFYRVGFAIARDPNRYVLTGVLLRISNGQMSLLGTDGKRLARMYAPIDLNPSFTGSYIIPLKAVDEFLSHLSEEGQVTMYLMPDKIAIKTEGLKIVTKLLAGEYPDVSRVIPESSEYVVTLHREELMTLLRQVALFTADNNHSVKFSFKEGELSLSANTSEVGEGKVNMPVNYRGEKLDIAFNPGYFLDILRHSKEETMVLGLNDAFNPGVLTEKEGALKESLAASPLFVIMPMRLSEE